MKLTLKNFRCYSNIVFEFNNGMTLIDGSSGIGKTTIFEAIKFALYGSGTKIVKEGKRTALVKLELNEDLIITRTKSPNKFIVLNKGIEYKDDTGQEIVNKMFGNNILETICYLNQNPLKSFVLMTPVNKLEFIEKLIFKDYNIKDMKNELKNIIKSYKEKLIEVNARKDQTERMLKDIEKPEEVIYPFPKKLGDKNQKIFYKNEEIRLKRCKKKIKKTYDKIDKLKNKVSELKELKAKEDIIKNIIKDEESNLVNIIDKLDIEKDMYKGDSNLDRLKEELLDIQKHKEYIQKLKLYKENSITLDEMETEEKLNYENQIKDINKNLLDSSEETNIKNKIKDIKLVDKILKKIEILESKLIPGITYDKLKVLKTKLVDNKIDYDYKEKIYEQGKIYSCPCCKEKLYINNDKLEIAKDTDTDNDEEVSLDELNKLNSLINDLRFEICNYDKVLEENKNIQEQIQREKLKIDDYNIDIDDIKNLKSLEDKLYNNNNNKKIIDTIKDKLKRNIYSSSCTSYSNKLKKIKNELDLLKPNLSIINKTDENNIREEIKIEEKYKNNIHTLEKQQQNIENKIKDNRITIKRITNTYESKYGEIQDVIEINKQIQKLKNVILENEHNIISHTENISNINNYNKYLEKLNVYDKYTNNLIELDENENLYSNKYTASLMYKNLMVEAETIKMQHIISSLNNHVQNYIDLFFDNDMKITIKEHKIVKKIKKPQIDIDIFYKGIEHNINMLSGGELARVVLAFTLALGEMFNIPLMMLDECTANLDESLSTKIFDIVKSQCPSKNILVIAHQVITGTFDNVISL